VVLDTAGHHLFVFLQGTESGFLICAHEAAVTLHIRTQDGGEFAFKFFWGHGVISLKFYNGNTGDKDILALQWFKITVTIRKSTETSYYWRLLENPFHKILQKDIFQGSYFKAGKYDRILAGWKRMSRKVFGTGFWLPVRAIFKRRAARGHNLLGWLQPFKSYEFVPLSALGQNSRKEKYI
jgi:hypothetical protein